MRAGYLLTNPDEIRAPELLVPAGQVESFLAAVENGADAIYLGLKQLSARASAANFSLEELAVLLPFAHKHKVSIYVALNSILTASDMPRCLDLLQSLSDLKVDALIVQDPGIFFLAREFFPSLRLHASTLMAIHNHAGVNQIERMGAQRVVLARELNLQEIKDIAGHTKVELEIFVHGALCYSYSGLCLASSFRGGHSGLQGRCVQPCRLQFKQGREAGFFLSCNDLCALPLITELKRLRLSAFKIEGRMKSADYIAQVVRAYRLLLDAPPENEKEALIEARELLARSPSRRLTTGYFAESSRAEILSPHRSGSSGQWVGTVKRVEGKRILVALRHELRPGDRLRPESSGGKERQAFTVSEIFSVDGKPLPLGPAGKKVCLAFKLDLRQDERLIRVGTKSKSLGGAWQRIRNEIPAGGPFLRKFPRKEETRGIWSRHDSAEHKDGETLIIKVVRSEDLARAFESPAAWVMLTATRPNLERLAKQRLSADRKRRVVLSLPPLIAEKDDRYYRLAVRWFCERGFRGWELNNWGHFDFFEDRQGLNLFAGYRFNVRNHAAMAELAQAGCRWSVLSLEITREELQLLGPGPFSTIPMVTLFSWPPLFASRLIPKLDEHKPFRTPRDETYYYEKLGGNAFIYADRPVNWLDHLPALRSYGFRCFLLDLSEGPSSHMPNLERVLQSYRESRADKPFALFNLDRRPQ
jgi:U32 family peptidase